MSKIPINSIEIEIVRVSNFIEAQSTADTSSVLVDWKQRIRSSCVEKIGFHEIHGETLQYMKVLSIFSETDLAQPPIWVASYSCKCRSEIHLRCARVFDLNIP